MRGKSTVGWASRAVAFTVVGLLVALTASTGTASAAGSPRVDGAPTTGRVIAVAHFRAESGGVVGSPSGVMVLVPPRVMKHDGSVAIRSLGQTFYDIRISVPWSGRIRITLPRGNQPPSRAAIVRKLQRHWRVESRTFGQMTVWVRGSDSTSARAAAFPPKIKVKVLVGTLKGLVGDAFCLLPTPIAVARCLIAAGIQTFALDMFEKYVGNKVGETCANFSLPKYVSTGRGCPASPDGSGTGSGGNQPIVPGQNPQPGGSNPQPGGGNPQPGGGSPQPGGGSPPPSNPPAEPIFVVMNTSEAPPDGVWFRNSPHTGDTNRVTGHGVYINERVQLHCYGWGDSVGAYNDKLWYYVTNVSRPTNAGVSNSGWLNAHYINDGKLANQIDAGVPAC